MKNLIVNADDLGLTPGTTDGIIAAHQRGIVTSTSALMNSAHIRQDLPRARLACPNMGIGVHLAATNGKPLLPASRVPSLVDSKGNFLPFNRQLDLMLAVNTEELHSEWKAQIEAFTELGISPDHLDSHHHISYAHPDYFRVMLELAREFNLPIRYPPQEFAEILGTGLIEHRLAETSVRAPSGCITTFYGPHNAVSSSNLMRIMSALEDGTWEIMCHPGIADPELIASSSYSAQREKELEILTSPNVWVAMSRCGITLSNFSILA